MDFVREYFPKYRQVQGIPVGIEERQSWPLVIIMGVQHLLAVFGGTILMPILMGFNPNTAIFFGGLGSLLFYVLTAGRVPAYLGSSAAFLSVVLAATEYKSGSGPNPNIAVALGGIFVTGCVYLAIAVIVQFLGPKAIDSVLPPVVTGSIVMAIGITLGPVCIQQITTGGQDAPWQAILVCATICVCSVFGRGVIQRIPIIMGIIVGYSVTMLVSIGKESARPNFQHVNEAAWFGFPPITTPVFEARAITLMVPVVIVFVAENIGHVKAISAMSGQNLDNYIGRALAGDALATILAASFGGTGITTYAENISVLAINRVYSTINFVVTCILAIIIALIPKFGQFLFTIPGGVIGGLSIVLFGTIAATGARIWADNKVDFGDTRNLIVMASTITLASGLATGPTIVIGPIELDGLGFSSLVCVLLYQILVQIPEAFFPNSYAPNFGIPKHHQDK